MENVGSLGPPLLSSLKEGCVVDREVEKGAENGRNTPSKKNLLGGSNKHRLPADVSLDSISREERVFRCEEKGGTK